LILWILICSPNTKDRALIQNPPMANNVSKDGLFAPLLNPFPQFGGEAQHIPFITHLSRRE